MQRLTAPTRPVLTLGAPPDGRGAALAAGARPLCFGALDLDRVALLRIQAATALAPVGLIVPGEDAPLGAAERELGRALASLLLDIREIGARLVRSQAAAEAAGAPLELLVDARTPELRALPWELLELLPAGEALGGCRIARIVEGAPLGDAPGPGLEVLTWTPTPEDPDCAAVMAGLRATLSGLPRVRQVSEAMSPEAWRVVHVVCHGGEEGEPVLAIGQGRRLDAAALSRVLQPRVKGALLVVLDVCGAARASADAAALPAWRVVEAGAAACLAPRGSLDVEASIAMSGALYGALSEGRTVSEAVQAGRRAMAALGLPDPSARWWTLTVVTADPAVLDVAPIQRRAVQIPGLERAAPDAAALLERAAELALAQGFLGIEHLALVLSRAPDPPPLLAMAQPQLASLAARAAGFQPTGLGEARPTPRLAALLDLLPDGFDLVALLSALGAARPFLLEAPGLSGLLRRPGAATRTLAGVERELSGLGPPTEGLHLEVLGGPEDGLVRNLDAGHPLLGRWDPQGGQPDVSVLFAGTGATDLAVSRRHLRWEGGTRVVALAATILRRGGHRAAMSGTVALYPGDVLELGGATRLEVTGGSE